MEKGKKQLITLDFKVLDADGITDVSKDGKTAGEMLAAVLLRSAPKEESDIYKFFHWGMTFGANDAVEMDKGDIKKLKDFLIKSDLWLIIKAAILEKLK